MTSTIVRAPGKTMWLGEYVVLDGAPAIVAAVDRHAVCTITTHPDAPPDPSITISTSLDAKTWRLRDRDGALHAPPAKTFALIDAVRSTLASADIDLPENGAEMLFCTDALHGPEKFGLGSSAAIAAVATVALCPPNRRKTWTAADVFSHTHSAHTRFQGGIGSGSDIAAACYGGIVKMEAGQPPRPLAGACPHTLVAYAGASADTGKFVRAVRSQTHRTGVRDALNAMRTATYRGVSAFEGGEVAEFLDAIRAFHRAEVSLTRASSVPIVTPEIADIVAFLERYGGAAKASGAGGGDIVIGFFSSQSDQKRAIAACANQPWARIPLAVDAKGVLERIQPEHADL